MSLECVTTFNGMVSLINELKENNIQLQELTIRGTNNEYLVSTYLRVNNYHYDKNSDSLTREEEDKALYKKIIKLFYKYSQA